MAVLVIAAASLVAVRVGLLSSSLKDERQVRGRGHGVGRGLGLGWGCNRDRSCCRRRGAFVEPLAWYTTVVGAMWPVVWAQTPWL